MVLFVMVPTKVFELSLLRYLLPALILWGCGTAQTPSTDFITLPPGFRISVYASNLKGARSMALAGNGKTVFVGTRGTGKVYAITDTDADGIADKQYTIASGLNFPNGVAWRDGALFVAEINRILRYDNILSKLSSPPAPVVVFDRLPTDRHHGWKYIKFGPDGQLYIPVGAPCNICLSKDSIYATITRLNLSTRQLKIFAHGIRNSVGFDWHPTTGEMWFTDNGRDMLGDDLPPDELNRAPQAGLHFGYPFCHAGTIADPEFGARKSCTQFTSPFPLRSHIAALGMCFYTGKMFPKEYNNALFICEHGSWNRTRPIGYRLSVVQTDTKKMTDYRGFAEGFLTAQDDVKGRPVDVMQLPDGSLLMSDDMNGIIYRITYHSKP
jgi:glucose/arabinose dehydrogenase